MLTTKCSVLVADVEVGVVRARGGWRVEEIGPKFSDPKSERTLCTETCIDQSLVND